ncbi:MAG: hypothetical protein QXG39_00285 [Candidatus Aenigmatarchaeota archaeon]
MRKVSLKVRKKVKEILSYLFLFWYVSVLIDFFVSLSIFYSKPDYFMLWESNPLFKNSLKGDYISLVLLLVCAISPFFPLSLFLFVEHRVTNDRMYIINFFILTLALLVHCIGHIFGFLSWLI